MEGAMDQQQLEEIKKRNAARTQGRWNRSSYGFNILTSDSMFSICAPTRADHGDKAMYQQIADADFIAHTSEDIPALVAEVERLQVQKVTPSEAIFAFAAWLTQRDEEVIVSAHHEAGRVAELCGEYCKTQGWEEPRDGIYPKNIKPAAS
jgi:hypothetical protein